MKKNIRFGIIADVQYARQQSHYNPDKRPAPSALAKLTSAVAELNKHDLDFTVQLGDLIDRDTTNFTAILDVCNTLSSPLWHVLGNHDFKGPDYEPGQKQDVLKALNIDDAERYYYRDIESWRFIVLDTNEIGVIESQPGTDEWGKGQALLASLEKAGKINAKPWNGALGKKQINWLKYTIDTAARDDKKLVVFAHHPIYPVGRECLLNDEEILDLLSGEKLSKRI